MQILIQGVLLGVIQRMRIHDELFFSGLNECWIALKLFRRGVFEVLWDWVMDEVCSNSLVVVVAVENLVFPSLVKD